MDAKTKLTRITLALAALAALALAAGMSVPPFTGAAIADTSVLAIHLLMELFAVIIAVLVVALSWHTLDSRETRSANILLCGFLIVASCDLVHALAYAGMPPFLGASGTPRAIFFWLMGRSVEVFTLALLAVGWMPPFSRRVWLGGGLLASAALVWFGSYHLDLFPDTFVAGSGVTAFKARYEYLLCALYLIVAALFWRQARGTSDARIYLLALSSFVMGTGEIMFTSYAAPSDFQNIFGHAFKVVAYALLYRATFVANVRAPFYAVLASETRLRESQQKLSALYELSPLGIALTDMQGRYIEFNEAFRKITGYPAAELKTIDYWTLTPKQYSADEQLQLESLQRTGHYGPYEKEYIRKDGSLVPLQLNGMLLTGGDGEKYIWSIVEDISYRKTAELAMARERTRLETILRTASDGIHILDSDGLLIEANDAFLEMLGYDRTVVGRVRVGDWDSGSPMAVIEQRIASLMATKERTVFETVHRRRDGKQIEVEISACGIEIEGRQYLYASSRDVTQRKAEQRQLRELNAGLEAHVKRRTEELARANRDLEAFSYSVSHDLRAPLRAVGGFARIVKETEAGRMSAEGRQMLERIHLNAVKMGALLDDVLKFARIGRHEMSFAEIDMTALAREVAEELRAEYPRAVFEIAHLPQVRGDASMLRQVWVNLIGNALKFSSKVAEPRIVVGGAPVDGAAGFFIRDNGAGFDMAYSAKLFEVFQRFHSEDEFPGTGAGLAIVKRIVERHGGRIRGESQPGIDTVFHFTLEIAPGAGANPAAGPG